MLDIYLCAQHTGVQPGAGPIPASVESMTCEDWQEGEGRARATLLPRSKQSGLAFCLHSQIPFSALQKDSLSFSMSRGEEYPERKNLTGRQAGLVGQDEEHE